jgi:hypothetical protein
MQHRGGEGQAGRLRPSGSEPAVSRGVRAPPNIACARGCRWLGREDMRCHDTCAPVAMAGSVACATTDVEGASDTGVRDGCTAWPTMGLGAMGHYTLGVKIAVNICIS